MSSVLEGRTDGLCVTPDAAVPHLDGHFGFGPVGVESDLRFVCLV